MGNLLLAFKGTLLGTGRLQGKGISCHQGYTDAQWDRAQMLDKMKSSSTRLWLSSAVMCLDMSDSLHPVYSNHKVRAGWWTLSTYLGKRRGRWGGRTDIATHRWRDCHCCAIFCQVWPFQAVVPKLMFIRLSWETW